MAGIDEVSARSTLAEMQDRLARDPASALGVGANASVADVRAAFLQLTKQYHPVRFGRMAIDIQKLSNEVFLALRAAHDALAKGPRQTVPIPTGPTGRAPAPSALGSQAMAPSPAPATSYPATPHPATSHPASSHPTVAHPATSHPAMSHPATSPQSGRATQPLSVKPARTASPNDSGERLPVPARTPTPATGVKVPTTRPLVSQPLSPSSRIPGLPGPPGPASPARQTASPTSPAGPPQAATLKDEAAAIDLLQRQQWDQARSVLHQLSARDPSSKRIRALMCYARGREAQLDRRVDDARVELQDALELDPDLQLAKTALTELFTRRK